MIRIAKTTGCATSRAEPLDRERTNHSRNERGQHRRDPEQVAERDPGKLWPMYVQLTEAEAAFRTLKSEVKVRPIWHWTAKRVEAQF